MLMEALDREQPITLETGRLPHAIGALVFFGLGAPRPAGATSKRDGPVRTVCASQAERRTSMPDG
jgi:hypothetical protein